MSDTAQPPPHSPPQPRTSQRTVDLGVAGASGAVGAELLRLMREGDFPVGELKLFGSRNSAGDVHEYGGSQHVVRPFRAEALAELDLVVAATPAVASAEIVRAAGAAGVFAVDASGAFRADEDVPLVVPAINRTALELSSGVIATPGALATAVSLALAPLVEGPGVAAVDVVALLAVSARGRAGMNEMSRQVVSILNQKPFDVDVFPRQVAFNVIPWVGDRTPGEPAPGGVTAEEAGAAAEARRVVPGLPERLGVTAAFAPTFVGHSVALTVQLDEALPSAAVRALLAAAPGLSVAEGDGGPDAVTTNVDAAERDELLVSRIRTDGADPATVRLWLTFDNIRLAARTLLLTMAAAIEDGLV